MTIVKWSIIAVALTALIVYGQRHIPGASETAIADSASVVPQRTTAPTQPPGPNRITEI